MPLMRLKEGDLFVYPAVNSRASHDNDLQELVSPLNCLFRVSSLKLTLQGAWKLLKSKQYC